MFGTDRILDVLNAQQDATPRTRLEHTEQAVDEFVGSAPQFDDLTMMCLIYNGREE